MKKGEEKAWGINGCRLFGKCEQCNALGRDVGLTNEGNGWLCKGCRYNNVVMLLCGYH